MRVSFVLIIAKFVAATSRLLGRGGGQALPGLLAEWLDPRLEKKLAAQIPHGVILVTGTNGKTTTTKLFADMLAASGETVLTNSTGSNLKRGIVSALIRAASVGGKVAATIALFEVDEANLRLVANDLNPRLIVVLNLFRDQLDRYGELDATAAIIGAGIRDTNADLLLNADDPLVASLAKYARGNGKVHFFGINEGAFGRIKIVADAPSDTDRCIICSKRLIFSKIYYAHLGVWRCPEGHFERPNPEIAVTNIAALDATESRFDLHVAGRKVNVTFALPGLYNLYNALASVGAALFVGVGLKEIRSTLAHTNAAFGRVERLQVDGREIYLLLVKNPTGLTQIINTFLMGSKHASVMIAINDRDADGRDVSWLWDVPFEEIAAWEPRVISSGIRAADMTLRLHYAGIEAVKTTSLQQGLANLLDQTEQGQQAYVLPTYTAMLEVRKLLSKSTQMEEVWK